MRAGEGRIPAGDLRKQAGVSCTAHRLEPRPGALSLRIPPDGRSGGNHGLARGAPQAGAVCLQGIFYW
jgi:hypothetical protein